jgi:cysteine desulfurase/selenocysteine lyase
MIAAIDDKTRLATASTVTFSPGIRADIETLGASCRDRGVFLLVDAAQSVGVMHTDVRKMKVDGLAVATQKALLGLYGMGFLYCRREWAEKMHPAALARFSVDLGDDMHEASTGSDAKYSLMPAARRFDVGNYNYPAVCAVEPSLDLLLTLGTSKIDHYVCGLSAYFTAGLKELGLTVCSGLSESELSHTVTVGSYSQDANESASDPEIAAIARYLQDNKIAFSLRRGLMRFASHLYNNQSDIDTVLEIIRGWKNSHQ